MTHTHIWKRDRTRTHGRPPRFFVRCECGATGQAVIRSGFTHVFQTSIVRLAPDDVKRVRSFRASNNEMRLLELGRLRLTVIDNRITIAV